MAAVQRELRAVDPTVAVENMQDARRRSAAIRWRRGRSRCSCSSGLPRSASVLTLVGIYGVLSLSVASRRREIAIRAAIGARPSRYPWLVFGEASRLIAGGVVVGHRRRGRIVARAAVVSVRSRALTDPLTLAVVGLLFAVVALLACWAPTRRAANVDPLEALRCE